MLEDDPVIFLKPAFLVDICSFSGEVIYNSGMVTIDSHPFGRVFPASKDTARGWIPRIFM